MIETFVAVRYGGQPADDSHVARMQALAGVLRKALRRAPRSRACVVPMHRAPPGSCCSPYASGPWSGADGRSISSTPRAWSGPPSDGPSRAPMNRAKALA